MKKGTVIKILSVAFILILLILLAGGLYIYGIARDSELDLSLFEAKRGHSATRIYVMQGGEWVEWEEERILGERNYEYAALSDVPKDLINAFVAIEDKTFYKHHGFNFKRMAGAVVNSVLHRSRVSGTSTITQQLARNAYLAEIKSQRSLSRKLSEMYCTIVLEKNLTKKEIMEAYLNTIYLGFNSYGVESAAQS